jgi:hypothetical protein
MLDWLIQGLDQEVLVISVPKTVLSVCVLAALQLASPAQEPPNPAAPPPPAPQAPRPPAAEDRDTFGPSIGLFYWYNPNHFHLRSGNEAIAGDNPANLDYPGKNQGTPGAIITFPAGRYNSLQISYFRTRGTGTGPTPSAVKIFDQSFSAGEVLNTKYWMQAVKVSWDYLTWPVPPDETSFRIKTLWQIHYVATKSELVAPALETETTTTFTTKNHTMFLPAIGFGFEKRFNRSLRWELKGSGMAWPKRSRLWDAETFFAVRRRHLEMKFGGRALHFRTSTNKPDYIYATLPGGFVEVSWH